MHQRAISSQDALLDAAGGSLRDVVKTTIYLTDVEQFTDANAAYEASLRDAEVEVLPARTTVAAGLLVPVEIEVIAFVGREG